MSEEKINANQDVKKESSAKKKKEKKNKRAIFKSILLLVRMAAFAGFGILS